MRKLVLKRLPLAIMILLGQAFGSTATAQDFSLQYDWNQNEEYQEWWNTNVEYGVAEKYGLNQAEISATDSVNDLKSPNHY